MSKNNLKQLSTYLPEDSILYQMIMSECKDTGQGVSAILKLALSERYDEQLREWRTHQFQPDEVPAVV